LQQAKRNLEDVAQGDLDEEEIHEAIGEHLEEQHITAAQKRANIAAEATRHLQEVAFSSPLSIQSEQQVYRHLLDSENDDYLRYARKL
jgi:hypothetical protein